MPRCPAGTVVHVVLDNYAAHKHPKVRAWLDRHLRSTFHFTPTSCSWLNAVEGFFATLSKRRLKRGAFHSVVDLQTAINRYLTEHNQQRKPFIWTADPDKIIAAVKRGHQVVRFHPLEGCREKCGPDVTNWHSLCRSPVRAQLTLYRISTVNWDCRARYKV
jgi:transposase